MKKQNGRVLLRAQLNTPVLYRVVNVLFALLMTSGLVLGIFFNTNTPYYLEWQWALPSVFMAFGISFIIVWAMAQAKPAGRIQERVFAVLLLLIILALLFVTAWQLRVRTDGSWLFGEVYRAASDFVTQGVQPGSYLAMHPQAKALYALLCGYFSIFYLFGSTSFLLPALALNCIVIFAGILCTYRVARKMFGVNQSLLFLIWACLFCPFLLVQAPLLQGATLAFLFVSAGTLLWMHIRHCWRGGAYGKTMLLFCILSLILAVGGLFQATVLLFWFAAAVDLLCLLCGRGRVWIFLAGAAVVVLVVWGAIWALHSSPMFSHYTQDDRIPLATGLMMGLSEFGVENAVDSQMIQQADGYAARQDLVWSEIQARLDSRDALQTIQQLGTKLSMIVSDGSFGASVLLGNYSIQTTGVQQMFVLPTGILYYIFAYGSFSMWGMLLIWAIVAAIRSFLNQNSALTVLRLALLASALYGLVWVAQPQHFICMLPLFLLCFLEMVPRRKQNRENEALVDNALVKETHEYEMDVAQQHVDYMSPSFLWSQEAQGDNGGQN